MIWMLESVGTVAAMYTKGKKQKATFWIQTPNDADLKYHPLWMNWYVIL